MSVTDALNGVTAYVYDANNRLVSVMDALLGVTAYGYDKLGRVTSVTDPEGGVTYAEYDGNGNVTKITDAEGYATKYFYNEMNQLIKIIDAEGYTHFYSYDGNGNVIESIDWNGNLRQYSYDALDRLVAVTNPEGNVASTVYDPDGRLVSATNEEGATTTFEYDADSRVTAIVDALLNRTEIAYDAMDRVTSITDARGGITSYEYNDRGLLIMETDAEGYSVYYGYDENGNRTSMVTFDGTTTYVYDELDRLISVIDPMGGAEAFEYDKLGRIAAVTDKNGNRTRYVFDKNGNIIETIDALNHSSYFTYDKLNQLTKVTLYRDDAQDNVVHEAQVTLYSYEGRGLVSTVVNAVGVLVSYVYDGNGNLVKKTDEDGYVTDYAYTGLDLIRQINYTGGKEAVFAYNKDGELVAMTDWNGTVNFSLDILDRIVSVNDHNGMVTSYTYDSVHNQTSITYPDDTVALYEYDLIHRMTKLTDAENQETNYTYNPVRLIEMAYGNSWTETYQHDANGRLTRQYAEHPDHFTNHSVEHLYTYDPEGNVLTEYRSGAGGQDRFNLVHTYDALNRLTKTTGDQGYKAHTYTYDSLGNLTYEMIHNKGTDYKYNVLNQQVQKIVDGKDTYKYTYDQRGNQISGTYVKNQNHSYVVEEYVYDSTNRMVKGVNEKGEQSHYIYNGLGYLVANEWIIEKNSYGYHGVGIYLDPSEQVNGVVVCDRHEHNSGQGHINPTGNGHTTGGTVGGVVPSIDHTKMAVIHKDYVLDYTSPLKDVILETESGDNGLVYRYTYGLEKVNTVINGIPNGAGSVMQYTYNDELGDFVLTSQDPGHQLMANNIVKLWYHQDHLGSSDFISDNVVGKVTSYVTYDDWGALTAKAVLKVGVRELDLVQSYTSYSYDMVLEVFFAQARMYDAADRRFMSVDPVKGTVANALTLVQYTYVLDNPVVYVDRTGLFPEYFANIFCEGQNHYNRAVASYLVTRNTDPLYFYKEFLKLLNLARISIDILQFNQSLIKMSEIDKIKKAQDILSGIGFDLGKSDGIFGIRTSSAAITMQHYMGVPVTGLLDDIFIMNLYAYTKYTNTKYEDVMKYYNDYWSPANHLVDKDDPKMNGCMNTDDMVELPTSTKGVYTSVDKNVAVAWAVMIQNAIAYNTTASDSEKLSIERFLPQGNDSGYRSYHMQAEAWVDWQYTGGNEAANIYKNLNDQAAADKWLASNESNFTKGWNNIPDDVTALGGAMAGYGQSNHGWGLAIDFSTGGNKTGTAQTTEVLWLEKNAAIYGFSGYINPNEPFSNGNPNYAETWHWDYLFTR